MSTPRTNRLESLEVRRLLAAAVDPAAWDLLGTDGGDNIAITYRAADKRLLETMNGQVVATRLLRNTSVIEISGEAGNDVISVDLHRAAAVPGIWVNGGQGRDVITGSSGSDRLIGGSGRDVLDGGAGDDQILGGTDRDELVGGDGNDYLQGNAGNDTISGGWGDDTCTGGSGADQLRGGDDADTLVGGQGDDTLKGGQDDMLSGGAAANTIYQQPQVDQVLSGPLDTLKTEDSLPPLQRLQTKKQLTDWITERAVEQWKGQFGQPAVPVWQWYDGGVLFASTPTQLDSMLTAAGAFNSDSTTPTPATQSSDHSTTNTQVAGVDEADIVETDGQFLYILHNNKLVIADASPAADLHIVSTTDLSDIGWSNGMYLDGNRLIVLSQSSSFAVLQGGGRLLASDIFPPVPATKPQVTVTVYDVSDAAHPSVAKQTKLDGWLNNSRLIDGRLYLVMQNYLGAPQPQTVKNDKGEDVYESESAYRARLESTGVDDLIPAWTAGDASGDLIAAPDVYVRDGATNLDVATVSLLNVRDDSAGVIDTTSVVGAGGQIFSSADNLYLTGYNWELGAKTQILKFGLGIDQVSLEASGQVDGDLLNSFSMDEFGQFFRIATTRTTADAQSSSVYVMDQVGDDLTTIGELDGIGPDERIMSARFIGDRAYVTTFHQVDPLFCLDLSDPAHPRVAGQLEIPGFSDYLHPVDDNFLIGLGHSVDASNHFQALELSLFDVSNADHPTRVDVFDLGINSYSQADYDYHAFSYFPAQHILALPVSSDEESMAVLKVDPAHGFTRLGEVVHTSTVKRAVRIGDDLFSIGDDAIRARLLADPSQVLADLDLPQADSSGGGIVPMAG